VTEAGFYHDCGNPVHAACCRKADGDGEGNCPSCGGDYSSPVAVEVRSSRPVQGQPAQFQFSLADDPDPDLGPQVFSCRRLPGYKVLWAQGFLLGWFIYYALGPFVMLPYVALMTSMVVFFALGYDIEAMMGPGFGAVMAAWYLAFFYFAYVRPLGDRLVLHEKGMRVRLGFRQLSVPFGSVERLYLGRVPSAVEAGLRTALSLPKPGRAAWIASLDGTAMTVVTADSRGSNTGPRRSAGLAGAKDPEVAAVVQLRYFAGLSVEEAAQSLGLSRATAYRHWTFARAWLLQELSGEGPA
jgi:hypothetical protein